MSVPRKVAAFVALAATTAMLAAQVAGAQLPRRPAGPSTPSGAGQAQAADAAPAEGLWPSPKLLDLMLRRMADNVGADFALDEKQLGAFQDRVAKRWGTFLTENRRDIQPVFNEFLEIRLSPGPPTKERLQAWARRALPVLGDFREQIDQGTDEFRELLNPAQRAEFEVRRVGLAAGLAYAQAKLTKAQSGDLTEDDLREFWEPTRAERERRRERKKAEAADVAARVAGRDGEAVAVPDQVAQELDAWDEYVAHFIQTYRLDEGQRDAASSVLAELRLRATTHRDTRREDIDRLERRIAALGGTDTELGEVKKQLAALYGPIDAMFMELKRRLESIPTAHQRAASRPDPPAPRSEAPKPAVDPPKP